MKTIKTTALIFSILACVNYGAVSVFEYDPIQHALVNFPVLIKMLYFLFGVSGFINILSIKTEKK